MLDCLTDGFVDGARVSRANLMLRFLRRQTRLKRAHLSDLVL